MPLALTPHPRAAIIAALACALLSVAHKTQRSAPGQAHDRRQYNKYGKVGQQCQEGFVSGAELRRACRGGRLFTGLLVGRGIARRFERYD